MLIIEVICLSFGTITLCKLIFSKSIFISHLQKSKKAESIFAVALGAPSRSIYLPLESIERWDSVLLSFGLKPKLSLG